MVTVTVIIWTAAAISWAIVFFNYVYSRRVAKRIQAQIAELEAEWEAEDSQASLKFKTYRDAGMAIPYYLRHPDHDKMMVCVPKMLQANADTLPGFLGIPTLTEFVVFEYGLRQVSPSGALRQPPNAIGPSPHLIEVLW